MDSDEMRKRRGLGVQMIMSRESSMGAAFRSDDHASNVNMKSLGDDSVVN